MTLHPPHWKATYRRNSSAKITSVNENNIISDIFRLFNSAWYFHTHQGNQANQKVLQRKHNSRHALFPEKIKF